MFLNQPGLHAQQGYEPLEALSLLETTVQGARFQSAVGVLEVIFYAPGVVRLHLQRAELPDYGLLVAEPQPVDVRVEAIVGGWKLCAGHSCLELRNNPLRLRWLHGQRQLLTSVSDRTILDQPRFPALASQPQRWWLALSLDSETSVYGLGDKFNALNRRGQLLTSWNEDATTVNAELSYKNIPFLWSPQGWGLFWHSTAKIAHGVGYAPWSHRSYIAQLEDPNLDLFLLAADTPAGLLRQYTHLTGRAPQPPRWSYGVWMSRAYYHTADEALEVVRTLRQRRIPCDVLLLDGRAWHKMETRFDFQWDPERYPDPAAFVAELRRLHIRLNLWEYPYISVKNPLFNELAARGYLLKNEAGEPYVHRWLPWPFSELYPHLMPSGIIDFTHPGAYAWYREQHKALHEIGVSVMKTDYGESIPADVVAANGDRGSRLHNVYALLYNRCVYEAAAQYGPDGALVWGRAGWIGSQRYPVQWGGDPQSDWEGLAASIRGGLSWGMSGGPYYSHDIGGFTATRPEPELYVRWAQAGVMASHTRFHGLGPREPWAFGEEAEEIVRTWLNWRYRLIPYLQACAAEAATSGLPVMRAMPLAFPGDPVAWQFEHQYMLGPSLLVAPVIRPGGRLRFYLPAGRWYDIWEKRWRQGPGFYEEERPLAHIPVFGREGAMLPLGPAVQHTDALASDLDIEEVWAFGEPNQHLPLVNGQHFIADKQWPWVKL